MKKDFNPHIIAEKIAISLFENGMGQVATRLVLQLKDGSDGGGWCYLSVVDHIEGILKRENK